ncbi:proline dehydrogenase family protein [Streptomyces sp. O3]
MTQEISQRALLEAAAEGLRKIATDPRCRRAFDASGSVLRDVLSPAARRYVLATNQADFLQRVKELRVKGYRVTAEFTAPDEFATPGQGQGQGHGDPARIGRVVDEYLSLLEQDLRPDQLGLDLSSVGLRVSPDLALANAGRIAAAAAAHGSDVVLSMDRFPGVDAVLAVHRELVSQYEGLGVTLQAHLHRTEQDVARVARPGRRVRLVKGAFPEPPEIALRRGPALDERYLDLAQRLVDHGVRLSLATQDAVVLATADERGLLDRAAEVEMLHGVQPRLLREYRDAGRPCRIYATYGVNWWLHLLQRLAEHPPMVLSALADIGTDREYAAEAAY